MDRKDLIKIRLLKSSAAAGGDGGAALDSDRGKYYLRLKQ